MSKPRKDEPLKQPTYKGGEAALKKFIQDNLKYPKPALQNRIEGTVKAKYDVDSTGKVRNIEIVDSLGYGCDEEVLRLIALLKYQKAYNKGRNVTLHRNLSVNFKLPADSKPKQRLVQYQLVSSPKKSEKPTGKSFTYTIKRKAEN